MDIKITDTMSSGGNVVTMMSAHTDATRSDAQTFKVKDVDRSMQTTQSNTALDDIGALSHYAALDEMADASVLKETTLEKVYVKVSSREAVRYKDVLIGDSQEDVLSEIDHMHRKPDFMSFSFTKASGTHASNHFLRWDVRNKLETVLTEANIDGDIDSLLFIPKEPFVELNKPVDCSLQSVEEALKEYTYIQLIGWRPHSRESEELISLLETDDWDNGEADYQPTLLSGVVIDWNRKRIVKDKELFAKANKNLKARASRLSLTKNTSKENQRKTVLHRLIDELNTILQDFKTKEYSEKRSLVTLEVGSQYSWGSGIVLSYGSLEGVRNLFKSMYKIQHRLFPYLPTHLRAKLRAKLVAWSLKVADNFEEAFTDKWFVSTKEMTAKQIDGCSKYDSTYWFTKQRRHACVDLLKGAVFLCRLSDGAIDITALMDKAFVKDDADIAAQLAEKAEAKKELQKQQRREKAKARREAKKKEQECT